MIFFDESYHFIVVILESLLEAAGDPENVVREAVCKALQKIAKQRTSDVVGKISLYREKKGKVTYLVLYI